MGTWQFWKKRKNSDKKLYPVCCKWSAAAIPLAKVEESDLPRIGLFIVDNVQKNISRKNLSEIPKIQKRAVPKSLKEYENESSGRNEAIVVAYRSGGFTSYISHMYDQNFGII